MTHRQSPEVSLRPARVALAVLASLLVLGAAPAAMAACGEWILDAGETCDDGNTLPNDCCSPTCQIEPASTICRASAGLCDLQETCTGSSPTCPPDSFKTTGTLCRAAAGVCD